MLLPFTRTVRPLVFLWGTIQWYHGIQVLAICCIVSPYPQRLLQARTQDPVSTSETFVLGLLLVRTCELRAEAMEGMT